MVGFSQFTRERQYLSNVSAATLEWYRHSFKWLRTGSPSQDDLKDAVVRMREKGRKATGCNSVIRAIKAYLKWFGSTLIIPQLKEPQLVLPTFTAQQIRLLVAWKPKHFCQRRLLLLVLILLDTGCRITEALNLRVRDVDIENLLIPLDGKGRKQRIVPFSLALRKALFRYISDYRVRTHQGVACFFEAHRQFTWGPVLFALARERDRKRGVKRLDGIIGWGTKYTSVHFQLADLIAYELRKHVENAVFRGGRPTRWPMKQLLKKPFVVNVLDDSQTVIPAEPGGFALSASLADVDEGGRIRFNAQDLSRFGLPEQLGETE